MPRPWTLEIEDYQPLRPTVFYCVLIATIAKSRKPPGVQVVFEHLGQEQRGRRHKIFLPLPLRPSGPTAELFEVCGFKIEVGATVSPNEVIGRTVLARFELDAQSGEYRTIEFKPPKEDAQHDG